MRIDVITLFPEWFSNMRELGVTGRALRDEVVDLRLWNPRDFTNDPHHRVDDRPYGGGPGMVMQAQPLADTLAAVAPGTATVTLLSPQGRRFDQQLANDLAGRDRIVLVCGRYEGIDQRFIDQHIDEQVSIGDFVLSGGELAAAVVMDAVLRQLPGVLGHAQSAVQDSFIDGLLDCPHYTRPEIWQDLQVPATLLSGDHAAIATWRRQQSLLASWKLRPDLLSRAQASGQLDNQDYELLQAALQTDMTELND
jgi:tRNA (guanine37-N1)-methyltransferase